MPWKDSDPNKAYRIRNVPSKVNFDKAELKRVLDDILSSDDVRCRVSIRTLTQCGERTKTGVFNIISRILPEKLDSPDHEWRLKSEHGEQNYYGQLLVDDHFRGFTVLYEPEPQQHKLEYVTINLPY
jgi:hypothetical protein